MKSENSGKVTIDLATYDMLREFKKKVQLGKCVKECGMHGSVSTYFLYYTENDIIESQASDINKLHGEIDFLKSEYDEILKENYKLRRITDKSVREFRIWKKWDR